MGRGEGGLSAVSCGEWFVYHGTCTDKETIKATVSDVRLTKPVLMKGKSFFFKTKGKGKIIITLKSGGFFKAKRSWLYFEITPALSKVKIGRNCAGTQGGMCKTAGFNRPVRRARPWVVGGSGHGHARDRPARRSGALIRKEEWSRGDPGRPSDAGTEG